MRLLGEQYRQAKEIDPPVIQQVKAMAEAATVAATPSTKKRSSFGPTKRDCSRAVQKWGRRALWRHTKAQEPIQRAQQISTGLSSTSHLGTAISTARSLQLSASKEKKAERAQN